VVRHSGDRDGLRLNAEAVELIAVKGVHADQRLALQGHDPAQQVRPFDGLQSGRPRQIDLPNVSAVVDGLEAVEHRTALEGDTPAVGGDGWVGEDPPDLHGQGQLDLVALGPCPRDREVAVRAGCGLDRLVIHGASGLLAPPWHAELQRELSARLVGGHGDANGSVPRVIGALDDANARASHLSGRRGGAIQVDPQSVFRGAVEEPADLGDEPQDVRRAACAPEPRLPMVIPLALEGVHVEEAIAG